MRNIVSIIQGTQSESLLMWQLLSTERLTERMKSEWWRYMWGRTGPKSCAKTGEAAFPLNEKGMFFFPIACWIKRSWHLSISHNGRSNRSAPAADTTAQSHASRGECEGTRSHSEFHSECHKLKMQQFVIPWIWSEQCTHTCSYPRPAMPPNVRRTFWFWWFEQWFILTKPKLLKDGNLNRQWIHVGSC